LKHSKCWFTKC